jgi:Tol biopolymer transport system component
MLGLAACRGFFGQAPIALLIITAPADDQEVPVAVTFDMSGSNDPDGTIASFDLDFGDGSTHATGTDVSVVQTHTYTVAGTYTVKLTITDNDGRIGMDSDAVTIGPAMITFASNRSDYDIWRMQADGSDLSKLLETSRDELFPDLVRGTRGKVAYAAEDGTGWDIWTLTVVGENNAQLTTQSPSNQIQPSWSYNASKIAYASNYGEGQTPPLSTTWEIYTMTATGGSQTQLTTQSPSWAIAPAYSPVNDDIAFVSDKNATGNRSSIWLWDDSASTASEIYDSDGRDGDASPNLTGLQTALNLPTDAGISKPAWKPDGTKIAFSRERTVGGIIDIYVIDSDGTDAETLEEYVEGLTGTTFSDTITTDKDEFCPYWLEDNSGLVFVREETAGNFNIYKVSFSTGAVTQLTSSAAPDNNVSPTSKKR